MKITRKGQVKKLSAYKDARAKRKFPAFREARERQPVGRGKLIHLFARKQRESFSDSYGPA